MPGRVQERRRGVQRARVALGDGRCEAALRTAGCIRCQRCGLLEKRRRGCGATTRPRADRGSLKLGGDGFIGSDDRLSAMPSVPVRVQGGVGDGGKAAVHDAAFLRGRGPVDRGMHERVAKPNLRTDLHESRHLGGVGRVGADA